MTRKSLYIAIALIATTVAPAFPSGKVSATDPVRRIHDGRLEVTFDLTLDSLRLRSDGQLYITPVVEGKDGASEVMPTVLVNGRNMHYLYHRGTVRNPSGHRYDIISEVKRNNGKPQSVNYSASLPLSGWMMSPDSYVRLVIDSCGCGHEYGRTVGDPWPLDLNPVKKMKAAYLTPAVTELPVSIHEGRARVQFEVDRTELHDQPYVCRNGQKIDNRAQLRIIDDSISYALSDPNVEIASINICGYASPESPYLHNDELSTGRSRALAEYLAAKYNLPRERSTYSAVPENWKEFRELVVASDEITPQQRADLLELIDRPAYGPADYDAKERELKTDRKFASLYRSLILPVWFPKLRATEFAISTRLKPLSDEKLAEVIHKTPGLMSLNQMMRVARLYPEGSPEFNEAIGIALAHYPDDEVANLNAAVAALKSGDIERASALLEKAGDRPEAENARGIIATARGDFEAARQHFEKAGNLTEADANRRLLEFN